MNVLKILTASALALALSGGIALAQDHDNSRYVKHQEWHKGAKIAPADWQRGDQVDWHAHHLRQPPNGYEWRQVDGNYVLAAAATGIIASAIIASSVH
jgi:Ni/Co efflux regulator RcnB